MTTKPVTNNHDVKSETPTVPLEGSDLLHQESPQSEELKIEHTIYAEPIAHVGQLTITNSLLNSWLAVLVIVVLSLLVRRKLSLVPTRIQMFFESVVELFLGLFDSVTGSREKSVRVAPFVLAFFFFILVNNWLGILPGIGSVGLIVEEHGEKLFIPYFRGGTADLNTTLALATLGVVASHIFGIMMLGAWNHINKFINIKAFLEIPKKIKQDPTILLVNPIKAFVGLVEIIGELAKVASLSFRLFGNIFAGEVLLASMSAILAWGIPIPFMFLEIIVGLIQALIFSMLILIYLSTASAQEEH